MSLATTVEGRASMMLAASELADTATEVVLDPYCALMWKSGTNIAPMLATPRPGVFLHHLGQCDECNEQRRHAPRQLVHPIRSTVHCVTVAH